MKRVIFCVMLLVLVYAMLMVYCQVHEGLHVLINRNHGISSAYNMTWFGTGYTYITNMTEYSSLSTDRKENLRDMHTFAEIVGYNSMMSGMLIVIMLAIQVIVFVFAMGRAR